VTKYLLFTLWISLKEDGGENSWTTMVYLIHKFNQYTNNNNTIRSSSSNNNNNINKLFYIK